MNLSAWDLIRDGRWEWDGSGGGPRVVRPSLHDTDAYDSEFVNRVIAENPIPRRLLADLGMRHADCISCCDFKASAELEEARGRHVVSMLVVFSVGAVIGIVAGILVGRATL